VQKERLRTDYIHVITRSLLTFVLSTMNVEAELNTTWTYGLYLDSDTK